MMSISNQISILDNQQSDIGDISIYILCNKNSDTNPKLANFGGGGYGGLLGFEATGDWRLRLKTVKKRENKNILHFHLLPTTAVRQ